MSTHLWRSGWRNEVNISPELQKEPLIVFHFNCCYWVSGWQWMFFREEFKFFRWTRVNTKYDRYLNWSGRTRISDTLRRSWNVFFYAGSGLEDIFNLDNNFTTKRLKVVSEQSTSDCVRHHCLQMYSHCLRHSAINHELVPALVLSIIAKAINQTTKLSSQIYNLYFLFVFVLWWSLCDWSRVQ